MLSVIAALSQPPRRTAAEAGSVVHANYAAGSGWMRGGILILRLDTLLHLELRQSPFETAAGELRPLHLCVLCEFRQERLWLDDADAS